MSVLVTVMVITTVLVTVIVTVVDTFCAGGGEDDVAGQFEVDSEGVVPHEHDLRTARCTLVLGVADIGRW